MADNAATSAVNRDAERRLMIQGLIRTVGMLPVLILLCIAFYFMSEGDASPPGRTSRS